MMETSLSKEAANNTGSPKMSKKRRLPNGTERQAGMPGMKIIKGFFELIGDLSSFGLRALAPSKSSKGMKIRVPQ